MDTILNAECLDCIKMTYNDAPVWKCDRCAGTRDGARS